MSVYSESWLHSTYSVHTLAISYFQAKSQQPSNFLQIKKGKYLDFSKDINFIICELSRHMVLDDW